VQPKERQFSISVITLYGQTGEKTAPREAFRDEPLSLADAQAARPDSVTNENVILDPMRRSNALGPRTPQALEMMPPTRCHDFF